MGKPIFNLRPDLIATSQGQAVMVMDTKWKLLDQTDRSKKYGISQSDMYQLYAYGHKYLPNSNFKKLMLIYPRTPSFSQALPEFNYQDKFQLQVVPFDVVNDKIILE